VTLEEATGLLADAKIENPRGEARLLLAQALGVSRDQTLTVTPTADQAVAFAAMVARRTRHEPFAYIAGHKEFWSLDFTVGPGVLVPRPDTETLIEEALRVTPDRTAPLRIADLGTGSGALLIAALMEFPNAIGVGFESSPQAFAWARRNADRLAPGRAEIRLEDWDAAVGPFDLVFSNPPYIPSADIESLAIDVAGFEPRAALDGGPDGLAAYRALAALLPRMLAPSAHALLEIGIGQANSMELLFPALERVRIAPDLAGISRCVVLRNREDCLGKDAPIG
jgi:release factor glutamine methyltransferase